MQAIYVTKPLIRRTKGTGTLEILRYKIFDLNLAILNQHHISQKEYVLVNMLSVLFDFCGAYHLTYHLQSTSTTYKEKRLFDRFSGWFIPPFVSVDSEIAEYYGCKLQLQKFKFVYFIFEQLVLH